ncbi:MAG: TlpA family protein disulfide reductase [Epsilonproteobacteria bacterium]|nr:TlpA family protein disulfide reductase [Campylobacterota bacterium]
MKKLGFLTLIFTLIFVSAIQAKSETNSSTETTAPSNVMTLTTYDGQPIDINITAEGFKFKQFPGKTVILDFFGPMCPPCIIELPHLIELQEKHKDELQFIAVQVQMPMENEELAKFVKKNGVNYPVVNLNDAWDIVSFVKANTNWGGQIPFMLMFDKQGRLKTTYLGVVSSDKIIEDMKK